MDFRKEPSSLARLVDEALDGEEEHAEERNAQGTDDAILISVDPTISSVL